MSKKISARWEHTKINEGYCQICGEHKKLTADHIPPKGSIILTEVEQKTITEYTGKVDIKGVKGKRGSIFKTICQKCNSDLGVFDSEIKRVSESVVGKIQRHFTYVNSPYNYVTELVNANLYLRGVVGHMLSSTSVKSCLNPLTETEFYQPLRDFVQGKIESIDDTHDIFYWFYPNRFNVSGSGFGIAEIGSGQPVVCAALYFYPIAVLVCSKGNINRQLAYRQRLNISGTRLFIDLSTKLFKQSAFPFYGLEGLSMCALTDYTITVSYSIK